MRRSIAFVFTVIVFGINSFAQQTGEKPAWTPTMEANKTARSKITVQNRCQNTHNFQIRPQNVPFLEISQTEVSVGGGGNKDVPVRFNTAKLKPKVYRGNVLVVCLTCSSEPTCSQDRENLLVVLTVIAPPTSASTKKSCKSLKKKCDGLLAIWKAKLKKAADLQTTANTEKSKADKAKDDADKAEDAAQIAEEAAKDEDSAYRAKVNDKEYHSNDIAYMEMMRAKNQADWQSGKISSEEYQRRANAITPTKAREERLKNKKRLKKEAAKARRKADAAQKKANEAKKKADDAQSKADKAKTEANKAKKDYEDCIKKVEIECEKIKIAKAKAEAEKKKREAKIAAAKKEAERLRVAEEKRKANEERRKKLEKERVEYLLNNIKKLGLIDSRAMKEVPGIWQWLPDILETPVSILVEQKAGVLIPTDTLRALGGLYGIIGKLLDPCTKAGKEKTIERLQTMINPYTKKKYTWGQALKKTDDMCKLLGDLRGKLEALKKAQKK